MEKSTNTKKEVKISFINRHKFATMLGMSVFATSLLVFISMSMYNSSGAAQLDLSRPGYISVRNKAVKNDEDFQGFSSIGDINQKTISEFQALFTKQANKIKSVDAFGGDPLSPESLGIGVTPSDSSDTNQ